MINRTVLVGRLTKDVELKQTQSGIAVARFTLAVNRPFSNSSGEKEADFIQVLVWRKQAENAAKYLKKGHLAGVDGRIQTGSYEGSDGKRVFTTEVVADSVQFLEPRSSGNGSDGQQQNNNHQSSGSQGNYSSGNGASYNSSSNGNNSYGGTSVGTLPQVEDDDLPF